MAYSAEQLSDREVIRELANRYARGVDRLDPDCMKSAYWSDAIDDHGVFVGNAWEFVDRCMVSHARWRSTMHCVFNHHIELDMDGVHARGEIYNITVLFASEEPTQNTWYGRYLDLYEKRNGEWRILHRVCVHESTRTDAVEAMPIDWQKFRAGSFDRPANGRQIGP